MAELVNLRTVRKQAKRRHNDERAQANRLAYGESKRVRKLEEAKKKKVSRDLDGQRIEPGDGR